MHMFGVASAWKREFAVPIPGLIPALLNISHIPSHLVPTIPHEYNFYSLFVLEETEMQESEQLVQS